MMLYYEKDNKTIRLVQLSSGYFSSIRMCMSLTKLRKDFNINKQVLAFHLKRLLDYPE